MKDDIDICRDIVVEDAPVVELNRVVEVLRRTQVSIVNNDDVIVRCEVIREIRADESGATSDENLSFVYLYIASQTTIKKTNRRRFFSNDVWPKL